MLSLVTHLEGSWHPERFTRCRNTFDF